MVERERDGANIWSKCGQKRKNCWENKSRACTDMPQHSKLYRCLHTLASTFFWFYLSHFQCISSGLNANLLNKNNHFKSRCKLFRLLNQAFKFGSWESYGADSPERPSLHVPVAKWTTPERAMKMSWVKNWKYARATDKMAGHGHTMYAWGVWTLNRLNNF